VTGERPDPPSAQSLEPTNPFSTRAVRPGAIDYQFPPDDSLDRCISRLEHHGWWGEIIGPHGAGKSTLVESLHAALGDVGRTVIGCTLTRGQRRLPLALRANAAWDKRTQVVVDGYEQLGWWQRSSLKRTCRRLGCGLLITAHTSCGLPTVFRAQTSLEQTTRLVSSLLPRHAVSYISTADIEDAFSRHGGNIREVLFDLYDRYERQSRQ